jgi:glucan endo-1,3-beta-D-glucosidase
MRFSTTALAAGALVAKASAENYLGFNSGATLDDRSAKFKKDFLAEFNTAANLNGAPGDFNSVRLYTNIQAYSDEDPIEAFEAAVESRTNILLGVWCSGVDSIQKEINAFKKALDTHGDDLADLVIGVSIGSEDLYRNSATGVENESGIGADPEVIVGFIDDWKKAFEDSAIADAPIGHVDTWDVWGNQTNQIVIDAVDFLGVDEYPYYENDKGNSIENSGTLFDKAYQATLDAARGKPVWVTETGWPYTGPDWDEAVASIDNAKYYWDEVGCRQLFNKVPTFWYTLRDSNPDNEMKFAITKNLNTEPLFDLTCPDTFDTPTAVSTSASASATATTASHPATSSSSGGATSVFSSATSSTTPAPGDGGSDDTEGGSNGGSDGADNSNDDATTDPASTNTPTDAASSLKMSAFAGVALVGSILALL